jgi:hypothetical protein
VYTPHTLARGGLPKCHVHSVRLPCLPLLEP